MGVYYVDTSALVKLYIHEPGTEQMLRLVEPEEGNRIAVLALARVEFRAAVRRRERMGDIDGEVVVSLIERFARHVEKLYMVQHLSEATLEEALGLVDRHSLRAYDAIQLAGCLTLSETLGGEDPRFVCADRNLLDAARGEGLATFDPIPATDD